MFSSPFSPVGDSVGLYFEMFSLEKSKEMEKELERGEQKGLRD